jgi:tRNA pseudouridine55 synthase
LLIILLGKATKLMNTVHAMNKTYLVTGEFGYETDTQDPTGEIIHKVDELKEVSENEVKNTVLELTGDIEQIPPKFSAKKVKGKRAYDLARKGEEFELKPKQITISKYEIVNYEWPKVEFEVDCSTGTYVRTLIKDLGDKLETYGTAVELRRTKIGDFNVTDAVKSVDIDSTDIESQIISLENLDL